MPFYKSPDNRIHWLDNDNQKAVLPAGSQLVSQAEADARLAQINAAAALAVPAVASPRQIRQALTAAGLRAAVEAAVAAGDQNLKDWWEFATQFERDHPMVTAMAAQLGVSTQQLDDLFALAVSL